MKPLTFCPWNIHKTIQIVKLGFVCDITNERKSWSCSVKTVTVLVLLCLARCSSDLFSAGIRKKSKTAPPWNTIYNTFGLYTEWHWTFSTEKSPTQSSPPKILKNLWIIQSLYYRLAFQWKLWKVKKAVKFKMCVGSHTEWHWQLGGPGLAKHVFPVHHQHPHFLQLDTNLRFKMLNYLF